MTPAYRRDKMIGTINRNATILLIGKKQTISEDAPVIPELMLLKEEMALSAHFSCLRPVTFWP